MLHGHVIVVKRTGDDGSKYPVTERVIKIGVTAGCHILINTPYVADEHCVLAVKDNGQVWVKNLSNDHTTAVNAEIIVGEVLLKHGDILEIGGRLVRWEYLPDSPHYKLLVGRGKFSPHSKGVSTPKSAKKKNLAKSPKTPGRSNAVKNTPKKLVASLKTPSSKKKGASPKSPGITVFSDKKSVKSDGEESSNKKAVPRKGSPSRKTPKSSKTVPQSSIQKGSPTARGPAGRKTPKSSMKKEIKSSNAVNMSTSKGRSPKTPIKPKTPKSVRKSLFSGPLASPTAKHLTNSQNANSDISTTGKGRSSIGNLNGTKKVNGRKSLQATKRLFSTAGLNRRNSEVVGKLTDAELLELANTNYRKQIIEEKKSVVKRQGTPLKRLSLAEKRLSKSRLSSLKHPLMSTIVEPSSSCDVISSPMKSPRPKDSQRGSRYIQSPGDLISFDTTIQLKTPTPKRKSTITSMIFSPKKQSSPPKRSSKSPVKADTELFVSACETPPEVVTPEGSPAKTRRSLKSLPLTPVLKVMSSTTIEETPPEVVTPRSSLSSGAGSPIKIRRSLPKSSPTKNSSSPRKKINSPVTSPSHCMSPLKSVIKQLGGSPRTSPRTAKADDKSPRVSFKLGASSLQNVESIKSSPRNSPKIVSECAVKKSPPLRSWRMCPGPLNQPTPNKRANLRNASNSPFKSARSSLSTPLPKDRKTKAKKVVVSRKKPKLNNEPDKTKKRALLVLGKASQIKSGLIVKQKLVKRAIKITNKPSVRKTKIVEESLLHLNGLEKSPENRKLSPENKLSPSLVPQSSFGSILKELTFPNVTPPTYGRRSSKRISAMNEVDRPDFTELSPSALGLTPRVVEPFRTPNDKKRRSTSLTTPRAKGSPAEVKASSTSKKRTSFSSKTKENDSANTTFDFQTPDISQEIFVSPLSTPGVKNIKTPASLRKRSVRINVLSSSTNLVSYFSLTKVSPEKHGFMAENSSLQNGTSPSPKRVKTLAENQNHSANDSLINNPDVISEASSNKVTRNGRNPVSPKNDLTDVVGVKTLFAKSPRNDLRRVGGVKKLLKTPVAKKTRPARGSQKKPMKSPKNDLTNPLGVKTLFAERKVQSSPKNRLSDLRGVKKLLSSPKIQKGPENSLTDLRGVKQLLGSPLTQKSPKNRLSDLRGVKELLGTPKVQRSPKNRLSDLKGVKELLGTPKVQKSPKNRLSDFLGVKHLLGSPKVQKSPKNRLSDLRGVKNLLGSPVTQKSPLNSLLDVKGVRQMFASPKDKASPNNDLRRVTGVKELFSTEIVQTNGTQTKKLRTTGTPVRRPTRSRLGTEPGDNESVAQEQVMSTKLRSRKKTQSSPKSDSPIKATALIDFGSPAATPPRRGRPKKTIENENPVESKSRRGARSAARKSDSSNTDEAASQATRQRKPRLVKVASPKTQKGTPARKTRGRGKAQPEASSITSPSSSDKASPKSRKRSGPPTKAEGSSPPKVTRKALRSQTTVAEPTSSPKVSRTRGKKATAAASSTAKVTKTSAESPKVRTRSARSQSNANKNTSSTKTENAGKRGRRP